jgi:hypothetical protein
MPAHLAAMAAAAAGYASAQECEEPNQTLSQDMEVDCASLDEEKKEDLAPRSPKLEQPFKPLSERSVHFSGHEESALPSAPNPMSIRSMHSSQRSGASQHRSMDIKLSVSVQNIFQSLYAASTASHTHILIFISNSQ